MLLWACASLLSACGGEGATHSQIEGAWIPQSRAASDPCRLAYIEITSNQVRLRDADSAIQACYSIELSALVERTYVLSLGELLNSGAPNCNGERAACSILGGSCSLSFRNVEAGIELVLQLPAGELPLPLNRRPASCTS
jgi:hypothetical protein